MDWEWPSAWRAIWRPVIFSGLARGVDAAAHRGAIDAKGKTVAVFGTGVDVLYPKENTRLTEQMLALGGALISEFPMNTFAAPQNFPIRNRIISGISIGVLVVEAAEYSGTRITSRCALEQNREVFRGSRQRDQQKFLGSKYLDQTRRQADGDVGRRLGRTPSASTTCADPRPQR
jgi:DNA protecting protein DprA